MKQEIRAARILWGRGGTVSLRITGIPIGMATRWVKSRELFFGRAKACTWTQDGEVLAATFEVSDVDHLVNTFTAQGWTYSPDFERTISRDSPHPMCRCNPAPVEIPSTGTPRPASSQCPDCRHPGEKKSPAVRRIERLERAHRRAAYLVGEQKQRIEALESLRKKAETLEQSRDNTLQIVANQRDELAQRNAHLREQIKALEQQIKDLTCTDAGRRSRLQAYEEDLEIEKRENTALRGHIKTLEAGVLSKKDQIDALTLRSAALQKQVVHLGKQVQAERERRRQDLTFVLRDVNEASGGVRAVSERIEVLLAGKEPHPYKHNEDRKD